MRCSDRRHGSQQDVGVRAGEGEMASQDHRVAAPVEDRDAAAPLTRKQRVEIEGL